MTTPYQTFAENFKQTVNSDRFLNKKINIFQLQTGGGKSFYQDKEMPLILKDAFPEMTYIFRLSPTNEVSRDGTFENVEQLSDKYIFTYTEDPRDDFLQFAGRIKNGVVCVSCTHTYFLTHFKRLLKYAPKSVLCVEEAHQFIGCGDEGSSPYERTFGYSGGEYTASTFKLISEWKNINPRVIGFTATPTSHHMGDPLLSDSFDVCNELAELESILPSQSWLFETKEYPYTKRQGKPSVQSAVEESIDSLFYREECLRGMKQYDPNIIDKVTGLYIAGDSRNVWGCPKEDIKSIIVDYLLSLGYSPNEKMIATIVEDSAGGIQIHDLNGSYEKVEKPTELFSRLQDPNDPVRFLISVNRCRSGINVSNLGCLVVCRIRDPKEVKTPIPIQIFGRMVRINSGTGDIIRKNYSNSIYEYLKNYPKDYGIDIDVAIDTVLTANNFSIWYPENGKAKRTWRTSLDEFKDKYVNSFYAGKRWIEQNFERDTDIFKYIDKKPLFDMLPLNLEVEVECPCDGSKFMIDVSKEVKEWKGDGTLDAFFNIAQ